MILSVNRMLLRVVKGGNIAESRRVEGHFCLCWEERTTASFVFVTVNRYIPYAFMKA